MTTDALFTFRRTGTTGCEILADGKVVAWTVDEAWATVIVALLNRTEADGMLQRPAANVPAA
jgi:hypothetical protein